VTHNLLKVCDINIFKVIEENEIRDGDRRCVSLLEVLVRIERW